jgi:hypothetical protein
MAYRKIKTMIKLKRRVGINLLALISSPLFFCIARRGAFFLLARKKNQKRAIAPFFLPSAT